MSKVLQFTKEFDDKAREITHEATKEIINDLMQNDPEIRAALKSRFLETIGKMEKFDFGYNTHLTGVINCLMNTEEAMAVIKEKIAAQISNDDMQYEINQAFTNAIMAKFGVKNDK